MKPKTKWLLLTIVIFSFALRIYRIGVPENYYFDEVYHAFTAKAYVNNDPRGYEWWHISPEEGTAYEWLHPPISKLLMAGSMKILGQTSLAWRLPSTVFGTLVIYLTFFLARGIARKEFKHKAEEIGLLASFLASLDGLLLVQSRIAMNDIFVTAFILLALIFYWRLGQEGTKEMKLINKNLLLSGIFTGLAIATKWSGVFILGVVGLMEFRLMIDNFKKWLPRAKGLIMVFLIFPGIIYLAAYSQFWLQGHNLAQFIELHKQIILYELNLDATHDYQSFAWQWPILIRPVWYFVDYLKEGLVGNIYALSNPIISWAGVLAIGAMTVAKKSKVFKEGWWFLVSSYFLVWAPWLLSPRIMFYYHYTPAIPFLAIALAIWLSRLWENGSSGKMIAATILELTILSFILFLPLWIGTPISREYADYFFWLPTWR